ncbi:hypothetical protein L596_026287 [Steinernema carpocapsae]|uniref:Uncharacterized protein n=1 Tax=Steinernema carpocapsae TaxID=34508 RepID=A0A4V5ZY48_STECR|nr:hypothetical protein L596_026287 [Steinernema carpocapsae]
MKHSRLKSAPIFIPRFVLHPTGWSKHSLLKRWPRMMRRAAASCGGVASLRRAAVIRGKGMPRMVRREAAFCGGVASLRCAAAIPPATNHALRGCVKRMRRRMKFFPRLRAHC